MPTIEQQIQSRIDEFVTELSALVREEALRSVQSALGGTPHRGPGRPPAGAKPSTTKPAPAAVAAGGRRTSAQIAATVSSVLADIKAHPGSRNEDIRARMKLSRPEMRDAIDRLTADKKVTVKGVKRGAKYWTK